MFGSKHKERATRLEAELYVAQLTLQQQTRKWNQLVERINKLGGESFLQKGEAQLKATQFSQDDIRRLLQLCHPDKHGGSSLAVEMTQKLLKARK